MHRIALSDGREFVADEDHTLLACADAEGIRLPRGCLVGSCCTCAARLVRGRVAQVTGTALTPVQRELGYILTCVAYARGDAELEAGPGLLPVLPWTE
ncbi:MAG: ferredoxin [Myxococcota bacterium]